MKFKELFRLPARINAFIFVVLLYLPAARAQTSLFDPSFAIGQGSKDMVSAIHVLDDGKILVGATLACGEFNACQEYLFRLHPNGEIDQSFSMGTDGNVSHLVPQPDRNVLVSGSFTHLQGIQRNGLGRLLTNGTVDLDFDSGDLFTTDNPPFALAVQPDGKILVATLDEGQKSRLFRLESDGSLDDSFVQTNVFNDFWVYALMVRTNGTILVGGGFSSVNGVPARGIALVDANGHLDTNFQFDLQYPSTIFAFLSTSSDQSILVGGIFHRQQGLTLLTNMIARLTPELTWDTNFNTAEFSLNQNGSCVRSILVQPDGKIVAGGSFPTVGGYYRRNIVRLISNGYVDPCFDPGLGLVENFFGAITVVRQPDGRLLVGGSFDSVDGIKQSNLARLLSENDCDATRVYIQETDPAIYPYVLTHQVFGTSSPGGTNVLQSSTNLVDWTELWSTTEPFLSLSLYLKNSYDNPDVQFFRIKKEY